jgi:hypothetical protein
VDVVGIGYDEYTPEQRDQVIAAFPRGDFKNEFIQVQTRSALKKPQTTFGTVNVDYIEHCDHTFRTNAKHASATLPGIAEPPQALGSVDSKVLCSARPFAAR